MLTGNASVYLPAIHFLLLIFSPAVANYITDSSANNLVAQNDYAFMKNVFAVLAKSFDLTPPFKIEEFFAPNTAVDRKVSFMLHLIQTVRTKEAALTKRQSTASATQPKTSKTKSVTFR